jgi:spore germination cell wall hydrolase CwlJ-like protein
LSSGTQARADWRGLLSAALIGSGVGLGLGASYLVAGLADAAADHNRPERFAEAAASGLPVTMLQRETNGSAPAVGGQADRSAPAQHRQAAATPARELDCLTQAVYFEARGETPRGQAAVAQVVMNRVANPKFPKTVCGVVFQGAATHGCQFSFVCDGSMRRGREAGAWDRARRIAARALAGVVEADVGKATHFHAAGVQPDWGPQMLRVAQVGLHVFYRFNPHAPVARPDDRPDGDAGDRAVFTSLAIGPTSNLRLATAVLQKTADATVAASGLAPQPAPAPDVKPAAAKPAKPVEPPSGLAKASEPAAPAHAADSAAS